MGKLQKGCDAEQSGVVKEGDELLEINGSALFGKSTDEIIRIMVCCLSEKLLACLCLFY